MPLPHFTSLSPITGNAIAGGVPQDVVYTNLFEITFVLPVSLQGRYDANLLLLQATKVSSGMDLTPTLEVATQQFKFSTRAYMKTPTKTHIEPQVQFNLNVNQNLNVEVYNTLRAWYHLLWDPSNGQMSYKGDLVGAMIVNVHDKKGYVIRRITYNNLQIKGISAWADPDWTSSEIQSVTADFVADWWVDEYIDDLDSARGLTGDPAITTGGYPTP